MKRLGRALPAVAAAVAILVGGYQLFQFNAVNRQGSDRAAVLRAFRAKHQALTATQQFPNSLPSIISDLEQAPNLRGALEDLGERSTRVADSLYFLASPSPYVLAQAITTEAVLEVLTDTTQTGLLDRVARERPLWFLWRGRLVARRGDPNGNPYGDWYRLGHVALSIAERHRPPFLEAKKEALIDLADCACYLDSLGTCSESMVFLQQAASVPVAYARQYFWKTSARIAFAGERCGDVRVATDSLIELVVPGIDDYADAHKLRGVFLSHCLGQHEQGRAELMLAMQDAQRVFGENSNVEGDVQDEVGQTFERERRWREARVAYRQSLAIAEIIGRPRGIACELRRCAETSYELGDGRQAGQYAQLEIDRFGKDPSCGVHTNKCRTVLDKIREGPVRGRNRR